MVRKIHEYDDGSLVEAARNVEHAAHVAQEKIHDATDRVRGVMGKARDKVNDVRGRNVGDMVDGVRDYVREHPARSVLVSVGVGALVGAFLGRR